MARSGMVWRGLSGEGDLLVAFFVSRMSTTLISESYRDEQKLLHVQPAYGSRGFNWGYLVAGIVVVEKCKSVLDYGAGKNTLARTLSDAGISVKGYDPAVPALAHAPKAADLVSCVDVMEHIEPECLDDVLDHIAKLALKRLFVAISTRPAKRYLSDGRNTHLLVEEADFWRPMFEARGFVVRRVWQTALPEWVALMNAKPR